MDKNSRYYKQVQLLLRILPFIANQSCFALKGGTAINLFVRDFPRLSVDIDLVYLPAIKWKLMNIKKMDPLKKEEALMVLRMALR